MRLVSSYLAFPPLPQQRCGGISLLHFSWSRLRRTLSVILPCAARTFLINDLSALFTRLLTLLTSIIIQKSGVLSISCVFKLYKCLFTYRKMNTTNHRPANIILQNQAVRKAVNATSHDTAPSSDATAKNTQWFGASASIVHTRAVHDAQSTTVRAPLS